MTIKEIENLVKVKNEAREQAIRKKQENETKAEQYRIDADEAATAGDLERYKELKALAEDAEAVAYVCGKQLEIEHPVTLEQTRKAWDDYVSDYKKKLSAKLKRFEAAKVEMLKEYAGAVVLQGEACEVRERLARYCGMTLGPAAIGADKRLDDTFQMEYIPCNGSNVLKNDVVVTISGSPIKDPDAVYYLASLQLEPQVLTNDPRQRALTFVVKNHRAFSQD